MFDEANDPFGTGENNQGWSLGAMAKEFPGHEREVAFTDNVHGFLEAGRPQNDGDDRQAGETPGLNAGMSPTWPDRNGYRSGMSPWERVQHGEATRVLDFLDAGKNPERDTQGLALKTAATGPSPTTAEPGQPQAQSTGETQGVNPTPSSGDVGQNPGPGDSSEEQRRKEQRDTWEKMKGVDPDTHRYLHGPRWPVEGEVTSPMGDRVHPITGERTFHKGVDIRNPKGADVNSSQSGSIVNISPGSVHGENQVVIRNRDGSTSIYSHTAPFVQVGDSVYAGDKIGNTDLSGRSTGPHLHYMVKDKSGNYIDPIRILPQR